MRRVTTAPDGGYALLVDPGVSLMRLQAAPRCAATGVLLPSKRFRRPTKGAHHVEDLSRSLAGRLRLGVGGGRRSDTEGEHALRRRPELLLNDPASGRCRTAGRHDSHRDGQLHGRCDDHEEPHTHGRLRRRDEDRRRRACRDDRLGDDGPDRQPNAPHDHRRPCDVEPAGPGLRARRADLRPGLRGLDRASAAASRRSRART